MYSPRSSSHALLAPGSAASSVPAYAPSRSSRLPAVDERLVAPESHAEIVDGMVYETMGANPPHATQHSALAHVLAGCLAPGYESAVDMLTRADRKTDVAPDVSVFPAGDDPTTGGRRLEEIAFEVVDSETVAHATKKVRKLAKRGVRRLFYIRVDDRTVFEWEPASDAWSPLGADGVITDRCFNVPIPVRALADRLLADDTVARALLASGNRVIGAAVEGGEARGELRGELRGRREALRVLLSARGVTLSLDDQARIEACDDAARLDAWITRAATAPDAASVLAG